VIGVIPEFLKKKEVVHLGLHKLITTKNMHQRRLREVGLIFPNVELRLSTGTGSNTAINLHLLVSPDDPDHVEQAKRFLRGLVFEWKGEPYRCDRDDLIRLGKAHDASITDDRRALAEGTNQFKVGLSELRRAWRETGWAQSNILIAVASNKSDGTSGLQKDSGFSALRKEIERFAHIILSATPKQREFWLGHGAASVEELKSEWGGPKPCIHGSDAHDLSAVGKPAQDRYCWLKGDAIFESLRQACIEPESRTFIGLSPPTGGLPSQIIEAVTIKGASWADPAPMKLNAGLVAVIGSKGSGKTALADLIAAGSRAAQWDNERSFVHRAQDLMGSASVTIEWADGEIETVELTPPDDEDEHYARVQYLSQQFVERLCSAEGATDELLAEIERVIFQALPIEVRAGVTSFEELRELKLRRPQSTRAVQQRLESQRGSIGKLSFSVRRQVSVVDWAAAGEKLLDLRTGPFRLKGTLAQAAKELLEGPWRSGSAPEIAEAMRRFKEKHEASLWQHAPESAKQGAGRRTWARKVSDWLYGADHVSVAYSIRFDGIEIEQQSPGTRGIVLLLLYLALDKEDDRPLIIDQPEENLDPRSVYVELVEHFRHVKLRRQIIIVTHNANLVVNADADQVIVAAVGPHTPGRLPRMTYVAGGLEQSDIRHAVCEILEGGEAAFQERARRLRLKI
jgi:energy-coupling factor transporter ATP-binding protein EcfA2